MVKACEIETVISFKVGDTFPSFADLKKQIESYSNQHHVPMSISDYRTLASAVSTRRTVREIPEEKAKLLYYSVLSCIHGGRKHIQRGSGQRKTSTFKKNCPCSVSFRLDEEGSNLVVTKANMEHANHEMNENLYQFYPKVRKLSDEEKTHAEQILAIHANKKLLQQQMKKDTGKRVSLGDLTNINAAAKRRNTTRNDLNACVDELRNVYHCHVDICTSDDDEFCGIFVQDTDMRDTFAAFPEILFVDATYKLLELLFPVYVFACEDSNGCTEIVGMGMLMTEDAASVRWLMETFKKRNPGTSKTRIVMADKDINEREIIKEPLPDAQILICLSHTLKTFKKELSLENMKINIAQRNSCLEFIQQMTYSRCEADYNATYSEFCASAPQPVKDYFNKNWHPIREEWVMAFKYSVPNFQNSTNNRLESLNGKLKSVINLYSSMEDFIKHFFIILECLRDVRSDAVA